VSIHDEPKIDCHHHVLDPARFPYIADAVYRPAGQEIATAAQFRAVMAAYGVHYALMVGPTSGYNTDNRCMLDAIAHGEGRLKGIAVVGNATSRAALLELKRAGIVGVALNVVLDGVDRYSGSDEMFDLLADLDMVAQIQVEHEQLLGLLPLIRRTRTRILIDHCGRPDITAGVRQPGFQALLRLADTGRVFVKLSGMSKFSAQAFPYEDARPYMHALLDAFGPSACMWASDWPFLRATERLDYGPLLSFAEMLMPDPAVRREVMWETPRRLFRFGE
jgi:predicted TIM-barrel fold metal-dependent hydrolase